MSNGCLALWDPRTTQNQGLKAGRQDVPVIREIAHHAGYKDELRCLRGRVQTLALQFTSCVPLATWLIELCASVSPSMK